MDLWGQVITLRGQILVSRTGDDTLRVLWCVVRLCVVRCVCCWCAMCGCWCWCVTQTTPFLPVCTFKTPPPHPRVYIQNVPVCTGNTPASVTTCGRGAGTHRDVLNVHTEFSAWHTTPHTHTHHDHNDTRRQGQTGTDRDRERQGQRDRERDSERDRERRRRKRERQEKTRRKTREEKIKRRDEKIKRSREDQDERQEKVWLCGFFLFFSKQPDNLIISIFQKYHHQL